MLAAAPIQLCHISCKMFMIHAASVRIATWGYGDEGQLGDGASARHKKPEELSWTQTNIIDIELVWGAVTDYNDDDGNFEHGFSGATTGDRSLLLLILHVL